MLFFFWLANPFHISPIPRTSFPVVPLCWFSQQDDSHYFLNASYLTVFFPLSPYPTKNLFPNTLHSCLTQSADGLYIRLLQRMHLIVLDTLWDTALALLGKSTVMGCMLLGAIRSLLYYMIPACKRLHFNMVHYSSG